MRTFSIISLTFAAVASQAAGNSMTISALSFGGGTGTLGLSNVAGFQDNTYYAGPFDASLDGGATQRVFCADLLDHTIFGSATDVVIQDTATLGSGYQQAARLYNKYALSVGNDTTKNAALQGAIWKSIFPTLNYVDGTAGASALTDQFLASTDLGSYSSHASYFNFGGANQSMIGGTPQAVPEPASMAALGLGALGLLKRRKR